MSHPLHHLPGDILKLAEACGHNRSTTRYPGFHQLLHVDQDLLLHEDLQRDRLLREYAWTGRIEVEDLLPSLPAHSCSLHQLLLHSESP